MSRDMWVNRCRVKIHSRFLLSQAVVLRWEQLLRGARPRIPTDHPKGMETPLRELATGAVLLDRDKLQVALLGQPYDPPRPEPDDESLEEFSADLTALPSPAVKAGDAA